MRIGIIQCMIMLCTVAQMAGAVEKETGRKYLPYKVTADDIVSTTNSTIVHYDRGFEQPADEGFKRRLGETLDLLEKDETLVRQMVAKNKVEIREWNGGYSGSVVVESQKAVYSIVFKSSSKGKDISQVNKTVFEDEVNGKIKKTSECSSFLLYDDADCVKSFHYGKGKEGVGLSFSSDKKLKSCGLIIGDQCYYTEWGKDGKIIDSNKRSVTFDKDGKEIRKPSKKLKDPVSAAPGK